MRPTRRQVLGAAALLLAAGCTDAPPPPAEVVDPDDALREDAVAREESLLTAYDTTLAAFPELAEQLLPVRTEHAEHLLALIGPPPSASPAASTPPASTPPDSTPPAAPAVPPPATAALALTLLADAERTAAGAHAAACLEASRTLASLLAALAASEHSHPAVLT